MVLFVKKSVWGFFVKGISLLKIVYSSFQNFSRNMDKDDVIGKSLDFQNALDSSSIFLKHCMCDVGDRAESKMSHCLTMGVIMFF